MSHYAGRWEIWNCDETALLLGVDSRGTITIRHGKNSIWRENGIVTEANGEFEIWIGYQVHEGGYFRASCLVYLTAARTVELATQYGRYGYRRITALLRMEGLKVSQKQPKRGRLWLNDGSCIRLRPEHKDHVWSYDFVMSWTANGKAFRILV